MVISGKSVSRLVSKICLGSKRQERQEEGDPGHAEHVAEIGAGGHEDILQRVRKGRPPFTHALHKDTQILLEQHDIRRLFGHIHGARRRKCRHRRHGAPRHR